jgi:hypothetical protein
MFILLRENMYAQPPIWIAPGQNHTAVYPMPPFFIPTGTWNWQQDCNDASIVVTNMNAMTFFVPANTSCCILNVDVDGEIDDGTGPYFVSGSQQYNILPRIVPVGGTMFPGQSFNVNTSAGGGNGLSCAGIHGCPGANITWQVSGGTCNFCFGNSINITVPNNPSTNPITINATYQCGSNLVLTPITVNVALQTPVITGPQSIGCGSNPSYVTSNQVTYNASSVAGAAFWVWTWPASMTPVGGTNGQSITFNITGTGGGNVTVQAFNANGGQVSSGVYNYPVNVCCTPVINETTVLNSGNAGYLQEAGSIINSTNDLQSTGTATMHAGVEVVFLPGFIAASGSQSHFYQAACNSGYYRLINPQEAGELPAPTKNNEIVMDPAHSSSTLVISPLNKELKKITHADDFDFKLLPNPSNGKVTLAFNSGSANEVLVIDKLGNTILSLGEQTGNSCLLDLGNYTDGVYAIRVRYKDKVVSKLLVKLGNN